jgi:CBS domain-containing protein
MKIQSVLATKGTAVMTIRVDAIVEAAAALLTASNIGALVVLDGEQELCGIISERDIVRSVSRRAAVHDLQVRDVMTRDVACASPSDDVPDALQRMTRGRFRHLPVVQGDELVGIVSIGDLVKAQLREYEGVILTLETELMEVAH